MASQSDKLSLHRVFTVSNIQHKVRVLDGVKVTYKWWVNLFTLHAKAYKVLPHIDGTPPPATDDPNYGDWCEIDAHVLQWIYGTLSDDLLARVLVDESTAYAAWKRVENIFLNNKGERLAALEHEFNNLKLENTSSLDDYCQRLRTLSSQIKDVGGTIDDKRLVCQLVRGLPPSYDIVASYVNKTLPDFETARSMLELELYRQTARSETVSALVAPSAPLNDSRSNSRDERPGQGFKQCTDTPSAPLTVAPIPPSAWLPCPYPTYPGDDTWYMDTGASSQLTSEAGKSIYMTVGSILIKDDIGEFKKFVYREKEMSNNYYVSSCLLLDLCLAKVAKKCTVHMLEDSDTDDQNPVLHRFSTFVLLDVAIVWADLHVLQTMFDFADASYLANKYNDFGFLPIHSILLQIMNDIPFSKWFKGNSIIKLIFMLIAAREMRPKLNCVRLVAQNTTSIVDVALGLFHGGDVKELAALLLLTYDDVFHAFKAGLPTVSEDGLPTISSADMISQLINGQSADVYGLVYLFDKVGRELSNLYNSTSEDDCISIFELADSTDKPTDMILKVATLIKNAGFPITYVDIDLEDEFGYYYGVLEKVSEPLGVELDDGKGWLDRNPRFPSVYCFPMYTLIVPSFEYFRHRRVEPVRKPPVRQYKYFSTAPQNYKFYPSNRALPSNPSLRRVAFVAMLLKRAVKLL